MPDKPNEHGKYTAPAPQSDVFPPVPKQSLFWRLFDKAFGFFAKRAADEEYGPGSWSKNKDKDK